MAEAHDVFADSILEPVDMPRWLRGGGGGAGRTS